MIDEIRRTAEHRLQEIEPLIAEADRLRDVLSVIERGPRQAQAVGAAGGGNGVRDQTVTETPRTPKGANKRLILELIAQRPGITASEIAQLTGVKRTVVASTVSRLKRHGQLEAHASGVRLAAR
jgi:hypothetical protein